MNASRHVSVLPSLYAPCFMSFLIVFCFTTCGWIATAMAGDEQLLVEKAKYTVESFATDSCWPTIPFSGLKWAFRWLR